MLHTLFIHATPIEGLFTIVSVLSTIVSIYALRSAMIDAAVQAAAKINGPRRMVAENNIHQEQLRLAVSLVMVLASISFLFLEPPPPDYLLLPQSLVGLIAWILVSTIIMVSSLIDKSIRQKLQKYAPMEVTTRSVTIAPPVTENGERPTPEDIIEASMSARASDLTESTGRRTNDSVGRRASDKPPTVEEK